MFHNPELNEIIERSQPVIDAHIKFLDQLSNDIRQVEGVLKNAAISGVHFYISKDDGLTFQEGRIKYFRNYLNVDHPVRPLIEMPANIRIMCAHFLPIFFDKCMQSISREEK